jgi:D-alanyl-D-alanine carboxypeptidase
MTGIEDAQWSHHRVRTGLVVLVTSAAVLAAPIAAPSVALASSSGTPAKPTSTATSGATRALVADALQELVDGGVVGAAVAVDEGRRDYALAAGLARREPPRAMRPGDQTRVGSITKTFMATIALQLVAEHRLRLDDSVEHWLPGVVPGGDGITVRMLLNHTSGIFNYTDDSAFVETLLSDPHRAWAPRELVAVATAHPPVFAPGQGWSYSNTGYVLVGLILERITHRPVQDLVARRITGPLHLRDTYFATTPRFRGSSAHGYLSPELTGEGWLDTWDWTPTWAWTAGAMVSNAHDLGVFYRALLGGRLLRPAQLAQLRTGVAAAGGLTYGLGIYQIQTTCGPAWGHDGSVPGYRSFAFTDVTGRRSVALLLNSELGETDSAALNGALNAALCGEPLPAAATTRSVTGRFPSLDRPLVG